MGMADIYSSSLKRYSGKKSISWAFSIMKYSSPKVIFCEAFSDFSHNQKQ
jgi:hypothetical protein